MGLKGVSSALGGKHQSREGETHQKTVGLQVKKVSVAGSLLPTGPKAIRGSSKRRPGSIEAVAEEMLKREDDEIAALAEAQAEAATRKDQVGGSGILMKRWEKV